MLTAKNLLYKALDYDGIWNSSKRMRDSEPSKARKLQLDSLLHAFQISKKNAKSTSQVPDRTSNKNIITKTFYATSKNRNSLERAAYIKTLSDFKYFTYGEFIADIDRAKYQDSLTHIVSVVKNIFPHETKNIELNSINLARLFHNLYSFRHIAYNTFESSFLKPTRIHDFLIEEEYSRFLKQEFIRKAVNNFTEMDELLCVLIDPENKSFTEAEIKYPEFDLEAIDLSWQKIYVNKSEHNTGSFKQLELDEYILHHRYKSRFQGHPIRLVSRTCRQAGMSLHFCTFIQRQQPRATEVHAPTVGSPEHYQQC